MVNNILSDLYCRIRNGYILKLRSVLVLKSKLTIEVLDVLLLEGFIRGYTFNTCESNKIKVFLKYSSSGGSIIRKIEGISKSGRRVYAGVDTLWNFYLESNSICLVLSTSKGVMGLKRALNEGLGGELLCIVF